MQRVLGLPDHLIVYPAHEYRGRQPSSVKDQKLRNPNLKPRTKQAYIDYLEGLKLGPADWMERCAQSQLRLRARSQGRLDSDRRASL